MTDLLADIDALAASGSNRRGPSCGVCALPTEIKDALRHGLGRVTFTDMAQRFLKPRGYTVADYAISRHFRNGHEDRPE